MTIHDAAPFPVPLIPESAPFSTEQRSWLNGFFAGLMSIDHQPGITAVAGVPDVAAKALGQPEDDDAPWHDPALAIGERMQLADGKPVRRKLFAAMAQQNCGQCGYLCESYAEKIANGEEKRLNLCAPGGKDTARMLKGLIEQLGDAKPAAAAAPTPAPIAPADPAQPPNAAGYSRAFPVTAKFKAATKLNGMGSEKDTRHIVFDISASGLDYQPGDSFGLMPVNDERLVDAVLAAMKAPADFPIGSKSFRAALIEDYALGLAPDMLFELASYMVGGARRQKLKALAKGQDPDGDAATYDVLKVLEDFGPMHPDPEAFLECLEPLQPRLYSISSSPSASPGELHLTVDAVRYEIEGRRRLGVASTFLCDRVAENTPVQVYVQKAHGFALPSDSSTPIIMVGPGTGIAPFRAFLWDRFAHRASGKAWLFFGHQREATDFYYRDEIEGFLGNGTLTKLSTAWSRDGSAKVYVQDRMREAGADLWVWLKSGAHFYVCGDAKRMAKDVEAAIVDCAEQHGRLSPAAAKDFVAELKAAGRYQADVY